jgi:hypothetical protein
VRLIVEIAKVGLSLRCSWSEVSDERHMYEMALKLTTVLAQCLCSLIKGKTIIRHNKSSGRREYAHWSVAKGSRKEKIEEEHHAGIGAGRGVSTPSEHK